GSFVVTLKTGTAISFLSARSLSLIARTNRAQGNVRPKDIWSGKGQRSLRRRSWLIGLNRPTVFIDASEFAARPCSHKSDHVRLGQWYCAEDEQRPKWIPRQIKQLLDAISPKWWTKEATSCLRNCGRKIVSFTVQRFPRQSRGARHS